MFLPYRTAKLLSVDATCVYTSDVVVCVLRGEEVTHHRVVVSKDLLSDLQGIMQALGSLLQLTLLSK